MSNKDIEEEISINLTEEQAEDFKKAFGLDELKEIHKRFENGTETIGDIKNHCLNYVIKNENGLELRVVEVKYFEKLIEYIDQLENKVKELEKENKKLRKQEETDFTLVYMKGYESCRQKFETKANKYDSLVSEIKERIEELKNKPLKIRENNKYYYETDAYNKIVIQVLQDLLETIEGEKK